MVGNISDFPNVFDNKNLSNIKYLADAIHLACGIWNKDIQLIDCNQEMCKLLKLSSKEEFMERFAELSPLYQPDGVLSSEKAAQAVTTALVDGYCMFDWMHQLLDGEFIPTEIALVRIDHQDCSVVIGYVRDLRDILKAKEADERMRMMLDSVPLCCIFWDENFNPIDCNHEAISLFKVANKQEFLDFFLELSPTHQPDGTKSTEKVSEMIIKAFKDGNDSFEWMHQLLDGELVPTKITLTRVTHNGKNAVLSYTEDLREIRKTVELLNNMECLANIDFLTGLHNTRYCRQTLSSLLQEKQKFSISFVDINDLKKVNDFYGHQNGDDYILLVASELKKSLGEKDFLSRIGGDEFVIMYIDCNEKESENKLKLINKTLAHLENEFKASISYGIVYTDATTTMTTELLLEQADEKMYAFKQKFKNKL